MAIGTQKAKIFQTIVFVVPIDMVKFEWNRFFQPFRVLTYDALMFKEAFFQKPVFEFVRLNRKFIL